MVKLKRVGIPVALMLAMPVIAFGYADPGTGAFIYQALFAAIMGIVWTGRKALRQLFGKRQNHNQNKKFGD